jgi:hypothetical protein
MKRSYCGVAILALAFGLGTPSVQAQEFGKAIKGTVVFGGKDIPKQEPLKVDKDLDVCLKDGKKILSEEWLVNPKNKGVKDVFVWLEPVKKGDQLPIAPGLKEIKKLKVELDQPTCHFSPHALVIREGQILLVKNPAPINHNFRWGGHPAVNKGGNINMIPNSSHEIKDLKADSFPVKIQCDIHPWMGGWIRVFDHPYFALTDADGKYNIPEPPAGEYKLKIWHPASGWAGGEKGAAGVSVNIKAGGVTDVPQASVAPTELD